MMKTTTIKRMLAVVAAVLTVSQAAYAQNYVKDVTCNNSSTQIVRVISENERVVYTANTTYSDQYFIFYTDASTIVGSVKLQQYGNYKYYINDFVVYDGEIYLCGYKRDVTTGDSTGIFGKINRENVSMISYCDIPGTIRMKKIAVFEDSQKPHLVMIGDENSNTSVLVDALFTTPNNWYITYSDSCLVKNNVYYDLTVTDNCVVVVGRAKSGIHPINIHVFTRPTTYQTLFFNPAQMITTEFNASKPLFVEHRGGDEYAVVASISSIGGYYFSVYNNLSHVSTNSFSFNQKQLLDMKHNQATGKTDVLLKHVKNSVARYEIIHHSSSSYAYISSHQTPDYAITSLDFEGVSGDMVAAGHSLSTDKKLQLYKYRYENYGCFKEDHPVGRPVENNIVKEKEDFGGKFYKREFVTVENNINGHIINTLCN